MNKEAINIIFTIFLLIILADVCTKTSFVKPVRQCISLCYTRTHGRNYTHSNAHTHKHADTYYYYYAFYWKHFKLLFTNMCRNVIPIPLDPYFLHYFVYNSCAPVTFSNGSVTTDGAIKMWNHYCIKWHLQTSYMA